MDEVKYCERCGCIGHVLLRKKCKNCGLKLKILSGESNVHKITLTKRAVKTAVFGTIGAIDDAGKTYQCENCGSKF